MKFDNENVTESDDGVIIKNESYSQNLDQIFLRITESNKMR